MKGSNSIGVKTSGACGSLLVYGYGIGELDNGPKENGKTDDWLQIVEYE